MLCVHTGFGENVRAGNASIHRRSQPTRELLSIGANALCDDHLRHFSSGEILRAHRDVH